MTHTDQSRAEFEKWARGESPSINLTREGNGYRYSLAETLYDAWQAALNYAIASNLAETATAEAGLRDCVALTTEQSSGVELPEPVAHINQNGVIHEAGYDWRRDNYLSGLYTEQQVRALLAGVKDSLIAASVRKFTDVDEMFDSILGDSAVRVTRVELTDEQRRGLQADCSGPIPGAAHGGYKEAQNQPETRMDKGSERGREALPEGYKSGIQTDERVTLIFDDKATASAWFEGFMDRCDGVTPAVQGWVAVSGKLPNGEWLVYMPDEHTKYKTANVCNRLTEIGGHFDFDLTKPSHYMPLPQPPKEQT